MAYGTLSSWFTILSNAAFLYPSFEAFHFQETHLSIYSFYVAFTSLMYHIIDEGGLHATQRIDPRFYLEYGCYVGRSLCYSFFWLTDHVLSALFVLIMVHFAMKCIFFSHGKVDDLTSRRPVPIGSRILVWFAHAIDFLLVQMLILFEYENWFSGVSIALHGYVTLASLVMIITRTTRLQHRTDRWKTVVRFFRHSRTIWLSLGLMLCGVILETLDSRTEYYQVLHGSWHVLSAIGIGLLMRCLFTFRLEERIRQSGTDTNDTRTLLVDVQ